MPAPTRCRVPRTVRLRRQPGPGDRHPHRLARPRSVRGVRARLDLAVVAAPDAGLAVVDLQHDLGVGEVLHARRGPGVGDLELQHRLVADLVAASGRRPRRTCSGSAAHGRRRRRRGRAAGRPTSSRRADGRRMAGGGGRARAAPASASRGAWPSTRVGAGRGGRRRRRRSDDSARTVTHEQHDQQHERADSTSRRRQYTDGGWDPTG